MKVHSSGLALLACLVFCSAAHSSPVQFGYSGTTIEPALYSPGQYSLSFTLPNDTQVFSMGLQTEPFAAFGMHALDTYFGTLAGSAAAASWTPGGILTAGTYTYTATVLSCSPFCISLNDVLAVTYYFPSLPNSAQKIDIGGTFTPGSISLGSAWSLVGATVSPVTPTPEPASVALVGTGLLGLVAAARRRFRLPGSPDA